MKGQYLSHTGHMMISVAWQTSLLEKRTGMDIFYDIRAFSLTHQLCENIQPVNKIHQTTFLSSKAPEPYLLLT